MRVLISGSMAFDSIMVFEDHFKNHILPDQIHILNVSFFVPTMKRHLGGCAGNIAYTLKGLGGDPVIMATVGEDFAPYTHWLETNDISSQCITPISDTFTAQAFITTDLDNNQINAFHPGAMSQAHINSVSQAGPVDIGIIAPNGPEAMVQHAEQMAAAGIPFVFDPGQAMPLFDAEQLLTFVEQARWAILNDYESQLLAEKTGMSLATLAEKLEALVVTKGAAGSVLYCNGESQEIAPLTADQVIDPTGCGDAYRAGVLFGLTQGRSWLECAQLGSVCGAIKVASEGTQNHSVSWSRVRELYVSHYGSIDLPA